MRMLIMHLGSQNVVASWFMGEALAWLIVV